MYKLNRSERTVSRPEALSGFDEDIVQEPCITVSQKLRTDEREDSNPSVHLVVVIH